MAWLFEARKRYGLSILNYMVTSNHVHLLVSGDSDRDAIPKSIQLLAGLRPSGQGHIIVLDLYFSNPIIRMLQLNNMKS